MTEFETAYQENYPRIWRYIRRHVSHLHDSEDLTADVFVYAFKNWTSFDKNKAPVHAWLYLIASCRVKNYYRDRKLFVSLNQNLPQIEEIPMEDEYTKSIEMMDQREVIRKLLLRLSEKERHIVICRYFLSKTSEQIAEELNTTSVNVRVTQTRALQKMESMIAEMNYN